MATAIASYKRKQGDSLWIDVTCSSINDIDPVWDNWTGIWGITAAGSTTVVLQGSMIRHTTVGLFCLRIGPLLTDGWATLPDGAYSLVIQIDNIVVDYRHEETSKLLIQSQGMIT